jgi:serine/threonine-protein kinase Chk1
VPRVATALRALLTQPGAPLPAGFSKVFRAVNSAAPVHKVAAVKVVSYARPSAHSSRQQHPPDRRALQKEVQIHAVLKHASVLEFIAVKEVGLGKDGERAMALGNYVPGLYMVLEYAEGGDLFDKIRE